jgi:Fe-S-cluster-containing dehydrogenase component/formate-dependent nitrite reductase membrane component NrfD
MNFGFIIDNRKCIGCHACTVACKSEHDMPIGVNRTWVKYIEKGEFPNTRRLFSVMRCNHCADAPCVEICPTSALFTRADGIVDFDGRRCIGCKSCMQACPYDALYIDPQSHTAAKCNYCAHRVEIGLEPACVIVCPEHAIISGDMDNPNSEIAQLLAREQVTARKVEKGTQPKLFYIDGDASSLNPIATEPSESYMWNSQASGVGHFAKFAESRISQNTEQWMGDDEKVLAPGDDEKILQKARDVIQENARRVYDAPSKGSLWGWEVAGYIWTKAIASGAFVIPFIASAFGFARVPGNVQWFGMAAALLFLLFTTVLLVKDLDQPTRFLYVLLRPHWRSWLVRGGYALVLYGGSLTLLGIAIALNLQKLTFVLFWANAALAIITAVYTAFLFAQAKGRDFWQSPTLALHMLVHAILAGAALFGMAISVLDSPPEWQQFILKTLAITLAINLVIVLVELVTPHPTQDAKRTVQIIVKGEYSRLFWIGAIVIGNLLPLGWLIVGDGLLLPAIGVLIGIYCMEYVWVRAPQRIPLS